MADGSVEIQITADDSEAKEKLSSLQMLCENIASGAGGMAGALSAVSGYISEIGASFESSASLVIASAASAADGIISSFSGAVSSAMSAGSSIVSGIASGISAGASAVSAAVSNIGASISGVLSGYIGAFTSIGSNLASGVAAGIQSRIAAVASAAVSLVQRAISAAKAAADIHSPSRIMRDQVGRMMGLGMAEGILGASGDVSGAMKILSDTAMDAAKEEAKTYKEIGSIYIENMTYGIKEGKKAAISSFESMVNTAFEAYQTKGDYLTGEYKKAADLLTETYKTQLEAGYDDALLIVKTRMTEIASAYQKEYDEIIKSQEKMQKKLASSADLFAFSKSGNVSLENLDKSMADIEKYDALLTKLSEKGASDAFLSEITSLNMEEGIIAAEKLLSLSDEAFENFTQKWAEKQELAKAVAEKFYADQLQTLDQNFNAELTDALAGIPAELESIGRDAMAGFISGMESKMGDIGESAKSAANQLVSEMRKSLDIHSPSKKMAKLVGIPAAEGVETGFLSEMRNVYRNMRQTVDADMESLSAGTAIEASRAAWSAENTKSERIYQSSVTEKVSKIGIEEKGLSSFARELLKILKVEENRIGTRMIGGQGA